MNWSDLTFREKREYVTDKVLFVLAWTVALPVLFVAVASVIMILCGTAFHIAAAALNAIHK